MAEQALQGITVLDLSRSIAGAYCTKLLADLGADVLLAEAPGGGHPLRRLGPFPGDTPHPDKSGAFLYFCANKGSVALDVERREHRDRLLELAGQADLVVESFPTGYLSQVGLDYPVLRDRNPRLVMASITPFGQTGPYRRWQSEEIVDYALGGYMYFCGSPGRHPLMVPNHQAELHAGAQAALSSLAALSWARDTGKGQYIDVSHMEAMLSAHAWTSTSWSHEGVVMRRVEPDCIPCKDGWVFLMRGRWDPNLFLLMDRPEMVDDPRFSDRQSWRDNSQALGEMLAEWCAGHTKEEIFHGGQELMLSVTPVNNVRDLLASSQLREREWFLESVHPVAGSATLPGFPYKLSETLATLRRPAPLLGQDTDVALKAAQSTHEAAPPAIPQRISSHEEGSEPFLPLKGIRILEITANWAGPLAGRHLADLGAEVIKIEGPDRPMTRASRYAGGQPFRQHYNRSGYFNKMNRNKQGITLNLNDPRGREVFLQLVKKSDVLIENNSPRVMRNFNLQYPVLREASPGIIMVSISGFGQTGPQQNYIAYGANIEASCGLASVTGYADEDTPYRTTLFYADPVAACHAAIAVLAALRHRERTGVGQYIEMSLDENGISFFPEAVLEHTVAGRLPQRRGNRHQRYAPQGCYPCVGEDMWMALCIRSDEEWRRFCVVAGHPEWAGVREYATEEGRRAHHDELDGLIASWTGRYDHNEASEILQGVGIPAAPVLVNWEMLSNSHVHERGFYVTVKHKQMGVFPYPGMPWKLSETPGQVRMAAPCFGEHNTEIFRGLLDLPEDTLQELYRDRVIADEPPADLPGPLR